MLEVGLRHQPCGLLVPRPCLQASPVFPTAVWRAEALRLPAARARGEPGVAPGALGKFSHRSITLTVTSGRTVQNCGDSGDNGDIRDRCCVRRPQGPLAIRGQRGRARFCPQRPQFSGAPGTTTATPCAVLSLRFSLCVPVVPSVPNIFGRSRFGRIVEDRGGNAVNPNSVRPTHSFFTRHPAVWAG